MRVRSLQTFIANQKYYDTDSLHRLKGLKIAVDAVYWLRTLLYLKDPLADAIGGLPPALLGVLSENLQYLAKAHITFVFVFQGIQHPNHMLFFSQLHHQLDNAWKLFNSGELQLAQHHFALATSRINSDFILVVSKYLQANGYETFQSPYFAASQLLYMAQKGLVDAVFGPPSLFLFGIPRVITSINFQKMSFEWLEFSNLLVDWKINEEQFVDACLLAGTEYCLTYPYLNGHHSKHNGHEFYFGDAISLVKQAPLMSYIQNLPTEDMRRDFGDSYAFCKALLKYPLALHLNGKIQPVLRKPFFSTNDNQLSDNHDVHKAIEPHYLHTRKSDAAVGSICVPNDFYKIVGNHLPATLFILMARCMICS